jgi:hypothetical protein
VQRDNVTNGTFAFTTTIAGDYIVCFHNLGNPTTHPQSRRVTIDLKHGVDAQDYSKVMRAEHLTPLQVILRPTSHQRRLPKLWARCEPGGSKHNIQHNQQRI